MKKRVIALLLMCIMIAGVALAFPTDVYAAGNVAVSVSSVSGTVGGEVTVAVKATSDKKFYSDVNLSYDASVLQIVNVTSGGEEVEYGGGTGGTVRLVKESAVKSATWNIKFKLLKVGKSSVKVLDSSLFLDEEEGKMTTSTTNGTVTVNAPVTYSSDNKLKTLEISPGKLTPAFSPDVTKYTVDVDASCYKLVVNAVANHAKAKIGVTGTDIKEGTNTTVITVTAENGSKRTYTITTNKPITPTQQQTSAPKKMCEYNGEHYYINPDYTITQLPAGFDRAEITYKGETMYVGKNAGGLSIMYLEHTVTGVGEYYVYDTVKDKFYPFRSVDQAEQNFVILEITDEMEKPLGYELVDVDIAEQSVKAMKNGESEFYLFYGMNEEGTTGWYSYDSKEGTIQRFTGAAPVIGDSVSEDESSDNDEGSGSNGGMWKDIAIGAIIAAIAMMIVAFVFIAKASRAGKGESHEEMLEALAAAKAEAEAATKEVERQKAVIAGEIDDSEEEEDEEEEEEEDEEEDELDEEYEEYDALDDVNDDDVLEVGEVPEEDDGDVLLDGEEVFGDDATDNETDDESGDEAGDEAQVPDTEATDLVEDAELTEETESDEATEDSEDEDIELVELSEEK